MTYSDPNRLDRIEALLESNSQQIAQLSQTTQFLTSSQLELARSMDTFIGRVDRVEQQVSLLAESQQAIIETQRSTLESVGQLAQNTGQLAQNTGQLAQNMERLTAIQQQLTEQQASTNAAVERLDRILDYLLRRDSER
ncbi:hypothetical protein NUACC21_21860 [Scytonema sp. NUACC21]